jgi:hypothetical protein
MLTSLLLPGLTLRAAGRANRPRAKQRDSEIKVVPGLRRGPAHPPAPDARR